MNNEIEQSKYSDTTIEALDPSKSVYISAVAGSGKTTMLINRILRLLLSGSKISEILCITFTRTAANEITKRLEKTLLDLKNLSKEEIIVKLESLSIKREEIELNKKIDFNKIETLYLDFISDNVRIQTIHSFCISILKKHSLISDFILDENSKKDIWFQSFRNVLDFQKNPDYSSDYSEKSTISNDFDNSEKEEREEVNKGGIDRKDASLDRDVSLDRTKLVTALTRLLVFFELNTIIDATLKIAGHIDQNFIDGDLEEILSFINKKNTTLIKSEERKSKLKDQENSGKESDSQNSHSFIGVIEDVVRTEKIIQIADIIKKYISDYDSSELIKFREILKNNDGATLLEWLDSTEEEKVANFDEYKDIFLTKEDKPRKRLFIKNSILETHGELGNAFKKEQNKLTELCENLEKNKYLNISNDMTAVAVILLKEYKKIKSALPAIEYEDFIKQTIALLSDESRGESILYQVYSSIKHVLIDEAQDVSEEQWRLIKILINEFYTDISERNIRTIFVVGDLNQSIFGFQGAKPAFFKDMQNWLKQKMEPFVMTPICLHINQCFRCSEEILKIADFISEKISINDNKTRHIAVNGKNGVVEVWNISIDIDEENTANEEKENYVESKKKTSESKKEQSEPIKKSSESKKETEYRAIASVLSKQISKWIKDGRRVADREHAICESDIMLLFRKRSDLKEYITAEFEKSGIKFFDFMEYNMYTHIAMWDLLSIAKFALQPYDDLNLASLLRSPFFRNYGNLEEHDSFLHLLFVKRSGSIWDELQKTSVHNKISNQLYQKLDFIISCYNKNKSALSFFQAIFSNHEKIKIRDDLNNAFGGKGIVLLEFFLENVMRFSYDSIYTFSNISSNHNIVNVKSQDLYSFIKWFKKESSLSHTSTPESNKMYNNGVKLMTVHSAKGLESSIVILVDAYYSENLPDDFVIPNEDWFILNVSTGLESIRNRKNCFKEDAIDENMRLLYVAVTRAINELYVIGIDDQKDIESDSKKNNWFHIIKKKAGKVIDKMG